MSIAPMGIPALIDYRGWVIWGWTGWKGEKGTALSDGKCPACGDKVDKGDTLWRTQAQIPMHWTCRYPDNRRDSLHAQWLASKDYIRFVEANCCDTMSVAEIPAGEYKKGASFEIVPYEYALTEDSPEEVRAVAKARGLQRLKTLIDEIVENEYRTDPT